MPFRGFKRAREQHKVLDSIVGPLLGKTREDAFGEFAAGTRAAGPDLDGATPISEGLLLLMFMNGIQPCVPTTHDQRGSCQSSCCRQSNMFARRRLSALAHMYKP